MLRHLPGSERRQNMADAKPLSLRWIAVAIAVVLCIPFFYRVPHALVSQLLPNDYVYRFSVSVTYDGKTYVGETFSGCRLTRSAWPDWLRFAEMGDGWNRRKWSVGINVQLPDRRFLLIPETWSCGATSFRADPRWKVWVGLTPFDIEEQPNKYSVLGPNSPVFLYNDADSPTTKTEIWTTKGAVEQGLALSAITVALANWNEVEGEFAGRPGMPWVAPTLKSCIPVGSPSCLTGPTGGFSAVRLTLAEAMEVPEFSTWAASTEHAGISVGFPSIELGNRHRQRRALALRPNWAAMAWELTDVSEADNRFVVSERAWKGDLTDPVVCFAADRCRQMGKDRAVIDWASGQVLLLQFGRGASRRAVFNGELP